MLRQCRITICKQYAVCFSLVWETIPKANLLVMRMSGQVADHESVGLRTTVMSRRMQPMHIAMCCGAPMGFQRCWVQPMYTALCQVQPMGFERCCVQPMYTALCQMQPMVVEMCCVRPMHIGMCQADPTTHFMLCVRPTRIPM